MAKLLLFIVFTKMRSLQWNHQNHQTIDIWQSGEELEEEEAEASRSKQKQIERIDINMGVGNIM